MKTNPPIQQELGAQLRQKQAALAEELVRRQFAAQPQLALRYGAAGREKCLQDANYHLAYLADAMNAGDSALFANYIAWAKVMLGKRGIPAEDLARHLEFTRAVVGEDLKDDARALAMEYIKAGLAQLSSLAVDLPTLLVPETPRVALAREYLGALLKGERHLASQMILDSVAAGTPVKEIYLHVFQPVQYEVGRLWQVNEISVAQEHYCTAATQLIMSQLYPHIFVSEKGAGTLLATCVAGDLHEIGVRMVTDFFEMAGWNTYYLGASTPAQAVVDMVVQRRAQVLGISATILFHLHAVRELIQRVRAHAACRDVKILVGGYPFLASSELWRKLGADGCAPNAQEAITLAGRLIAEGGQA
jgi:methanogenic corrinoid protein MtbC1